MTRMKFKNLFLNFLDIWGFGSRPMFRTIQNMFTRPGYMLREYLTGHQPLYFPPFKMLVVIIVVFLMSAWLLNANLSHEFTLGGLIKETESSLSPTASQLVNYIDKLLFWLYDHLAFAVLAMQLFAVIATRIAFRRCKLKWTMVELFFVHIYLAAQYYILEIACIWTLGNDIDDANHGLVFSAISILYQWLTFTQLYELGPWKSLLYFMFRGIWYVVIVFVAILIPILILSLI